MEIKMKRAARYSERVQQVLGLSKLCLFQFTSLPSLSIIKHSPFKMTYFIATEGPIVLRAVFYISQRASLSK